MNHAKNLRVLAGLAGLALATVCLQTVSQAQDDVQPASQGTGQPARAIRLSYIDGQARLTQGDQVLADQAVVNTPLLEGMQLATSDSGKAEIQFEDGSVVRIPPDSSLALSALRGTGSGADAELTLNSGLAYFELQGGYQNGKINVHFGNSTVTTSGFTVLRIDMDRAPGQVSVFSGNAHLDSNNGAVEIDLHDGESVALNATDPSHYDMAETIEPDSWDGWNSDRDQVLTTEAATQTGAPANMGQNQNPAWNDLDANGNWYNVPGQGYIWSPYDAANAGFDPYGNGNWMWTPGFGYIWASGYPWGYLPFQCGAWNFYDSFGWGWAPGMGGCNPWWGMGFYGGPNYGYVPSGYRPIPRPILPRHPIAGHPVPVVAINHPVPVGHGSFPARNFNKPVTIAGNSVRPLQPLPNQPGYNHSPTMIVGTARGNNTRPVAGQPGGERPGYSKPSGFSPAQGEQNRPQENQSSGFGSWFGHGNSSNDSRPATGQPSHPSNGGNGVGGGNPGNSGAGARPSGGGAAPSGGGGHPSGGGGMPSGGGGGGGHPSGGGGGGGFSGGGGGGGGNSGGGGGGSHGGGGGGGGGNSGGSSGGGHH